MCTPTSERHDPWMLESREQRDRGKPLGLIRLTRARVKHFDNDRPIELRVIGGVDDPASGPCQLRLDVVARA